MAIKQEWHSAKQRSTIMLNVIKLRLIMASVVMLIVIMLIVVASGEKST
jgi:hypothetical protein